MPKIEYLSSPTPVSMADHWFSVSTTGHFWIRRRFEVFQKLAGDLLRNSREIAEIGCGHGLVQRQVEEAYGREVTGFDLNELALQRNQSQRSAVCCYDISQQAPRFHQRFNSIVMFDVLEHIDDEDRFLKAAMFHLAPRGYLAINVPAGQWIYSNYDRAAGHKRRYSIATLRAVTGRNGYDVVRWTYWGMPLIPLALLRKLWVARNQDEESTITSGFDSRSDSMNAALGRLSRCEPIPQKLVGASVMAIVTPSVPQVGQRRVREGS
jgi:SAM-dependent methyltransferase